MSQSGRIDPPHAIYIAQSTLPGAGRGVFAAKAIPKDTLIEACPVLMHRDAKDRARLRKTELVNYYFLWGDRRDHSAICFGWGSVYNHSFTPNAYYLKRLEDSRMDFFALRDIEEGEEILVNYNGDPTNTTPLRIPGIPVAAGGAPQSQLPRPVDGVMRRMKLLKKWFVSRSGASLIPLLHFTVV